MTLFLFFYRASKDESPLICFRILMSLNIGLKARAPSLFFEKENIEMLKIIVLEIRMRRFLVSDERDGRNTAALVIGMQLTARALCWNDVPRLRG